MKRKLTQLFIILLVLLSIILAACSNKNGSGEDIVGKWRYTTERGNDQTYVFNSDGTIELITALGTASGTYRVEGDTINYTMTMPNGKIKSDSFTFKLDKDAIELTISGQTYTYTRVS